MKRSSLQKIRLHGSFPRLALVSLVALACSEAGPEPHELASQRTPQRGGQLVVALPSEPETFNPVLPVGSGTHSVVDRMHADLVHINQLTQEVEPALAESWDVSADETVYTIHLRPGLQFSDGEPCDADDVLFTYRVHLDPAVGSPQRDLLSPEGEALHLAKVDSTTIEFTLPVPLAVGLRLFDSIAILPEHLLRTAWEAGLLPEAWKTSTPASEVAGMGPFRLKTYEPGGHLDLERNPHYWKRDQDSQPLPYLDQLRFIFVGDDDAQVLRFQAGESDLIDDLSSDNFVALGAAGTSTFQLVDAGPSLTREMMIANLNQLPPNVPQEHIRAQEWLTETAFRTAISSAIDRSSLVRLAYQDRASPLRSNVSPGDLFWQNRSLPDPERNIDRARAGLQDAGFKWVNDQLVDPKGAQVSLSLLTSSSNSKRLKMAAIIQQDLADLGIDLQVVSLPHAAVLERLFQTFAFDLILLGLGSGDADPNPALPFLLSDGGLHVWRMTETQALSPWQSEIDSLMKAQLTETDRETRKSIYDRVQEIMAEELPVIPLVSPHILAAAQANIGNFKPAILAPHTLWNADELFLANP